MRGAGLKGNVAIACFLEDERHALAHAIGVAQAHPSYAAMSRAVERNVDVGFIGPNGAHPRPERLQIVAEAVRRAAHWVDAPPNIFNVDAFVQAAQEVARRNPGVSVMVVRGQQLVEQGLGGIHGVDATVTDDDGGGTYNPNVFTFGSGLDLISNWTSWAKNGVTCSATANPTLLSNCTQHGSQRYQRIGGTPNRTYRNP